MTHWKKRSAMLLVAMICTCGCGQGEEIVEEQPKTTPIAILSADEITITPAGGTISKINGIIHDYVEEELIIDVAMCNAMNRKLTRDNKSGASLFCLDEETKAIYFVNQNKDDYLYRRKDGVVELVVEMPVKEVYPFGDYVYFMLESYGKYDIGEKHSGDIYRYHSKTGKVELVYEAGAIEDSKNHKMTVNEDGIHFNYSKQISKEDGMTLIRVYSYTLPFGETKPVKDTKKLGKAGWGNYYFSYEFLTEDHTTQADLMLVSKTKGTEDIIPVTRDAFEYCVVGDDLYTIALGSSTLYISNLESKTTRKHDFRASMVNANIYLNEEKKEAFGVGVEEIRHFTTTENGAIIWITDGEYLYKLDTRIGNAIPLGFATVDGLRKIENLYTDGQYVYALYSSEPTVTPTLVRFCTEQEAERKDDEAILYIEYLTGG